MLHKHGIVLVAFSLLLRASLTQRYPSCSYEGGDALTTTRLLRRYNSAGPALSCVYSANNEEIASRSDCCTYVDPGGRWQFACQADSPVCVRLLRTNEPMQLKLLDFLGFVMERGCLNLYPQEVGCVCHVPEAMEPINDAQILSSFGIPCFTNNSYPLGDGARCLEVPPIHPQYAGLDFCAQAFPNDLHSVLEQSMSPPGISPTQPATVSEDPAATQFPSTVDIGAPTPVVSPVELFPVQAPVLVDDKKEPSCFPGHATVELKTGVAKEMRFLQVGDVVKIGHDHYSPVFAFTHRDKFAKSSFIRLSIQGGVELLVTSGHFVYVNSNELVPANTVAVGQALHLGDGSFSAVVSITREISTGLYNPQTLHGDIIVDGVRTSTYTNAIEPTAAHCALLPLRVWYQMSGFGLRFLENERSEVRRHLEAALNVVTNLVGTYAGE